MLFKRGVSGISKGFCRKLRKPFLQVLLLLSRTCESKLDHFYVNFHCFSQSSWKISFKFSKWFVHEIDTDIFKDAFGVATSKELQFTSVHYKGLNSSGSKSVLLTHSCKDSTAHTECNSNSGLSHPSRA